MFFLVIFQMNDIFQKQNTELFIERLRAQGRVYDKAKVYSLWIVLVSIVVVLLINVMKIAFPDFEQLKSISVAYGVFSTVICAVLEWHRKKLKNFAARIQQLIDCELFDIEWWRNWGNKPTLDEVQEAAEGEEPDRYIDWYDVAINNVNKQIATLICFRINIRYDNTLRKMYIAVCHWVFWAVMVVFAAVCLWQNFTILDILCYGIAPLLPVVMMYVRTWMAEISDTQNLDNIRKEVDSMCHRIKAGEELSKEEYQLIQDAIYSHRKNSFSIPSFYYERHRNKNEESTHHFAESLVREFTT